MRITRVDESSGQVNRCRRVVWCFWVVSLAVLYLLGIGPGFYWCWVVDRRCIHVFNLVYWPIHQLCQQFPGLKGIVSAYIQLWL